jgi:hypothetical protein
MTKSVLILCAAAAAFFTVTFMLPQTLNATPAMPTAGAEIVSPEEVPGMADSFHAEKTRAVRQDLPAQF